jgi:hypothetical protein
VTNARFGAPWGTQVAAGSLIAGGTLGLIAIEVLSSSSSYRWPAVGLLLLIVAGALAYSIRGYTVTGWDLHIHRVLHTTTVSLQGLLHVDVAPYALVGARRVVGIGSFLSTQGTFATPRGPVRAFVSDERKTVTLRLPTGTIVVSPDDPVAFQRIVAERLVQQRDDGAAPS